VTTVWHRFARSGTFGLLLALLLTLTVPVAPLLAQPEETTISEELAENSDFLAPVMIDGEELFLVRGTSALPATKRAANVQNKLIEIAGSSDAKTVKIDIRPTDLGPAIFADGANITTVTQADAELEQIEVDVLVSLQADTISKAILKYRADRTDEARVDSAIEVALWSIAFVLFTVLMLWTRKWLKRRINRLVHRYFADLDTVTNAQVQSQAIAALIRYGFSFVLLVLYFVGLYYYLSLVLLAVAETRPFAQLLLTYVTGPVVQVVFGLIGFIPDLITLGVIALLTLYIIKGLRVFFNAVEVGTFDLGDFDPNWINPTFNILRTLVILIAIIFAFPYIPGSDSSAFKGLTLLLGAMLSLGANSVVGNVLAGLFVIYRRSTSIGDRIKIGEHIGDVVEIKLMETYMKSIKNELVSIPNAQLLNSEVINYSKRTDGAGLLLHTTVGIGYEEPPAKIEAMLVEAANRTPGLKRRPDPFVLWTSLADYAINYQINAYTTRGSSIPKITSDLLRNIVAVFNENQVQIMTPSYIADPSEPKIATQEWNGVLAHTQDQSEG
jgi:small-conductance mechanosensitive channel